MKAAQVTTYPDLGARYVYQGVRAELCGQVLTYVGLRPASKKLNILQFATAAGEMIEVSQAIWLGVLTRV
jgi:hypothetical protein